MEKGSERMNKIVTFIVGTSELDADTKAKLDAEVAALGFKTTIPCSEGGDLSLPDGTFVSLFDIRSRGMVPEHRFSDVRYRTQHF